MAIAKLRPDQVNWQAKEMIVNSLELFDFAIEMTALYYLYYLIFSQLISLFVPQCFIPPLAFIKCINYALYAV